MSKVTLMIRAILDSLLGLKLTPAALMPLT
jgi:hypothetical protein